MTVATVDYTNLHLESLLLQGLDDPASQGRIAATCIHIRMYLSLVIQIDSIYRYITVLFKE